MNSATENGASSDRCCWQIVAPMQTGSERSSTSAAPGPTLHRSKVAKTPSASVPNSTGRVIWSNASSTRSSYVGASLPTMTISRPNTLPSSSSRRSASGCALMSPRPGNRFSAKPLLRRRNRIITSQVIARPGHDRQDQPGNFKGRANGWIHRRGDAPRIERDNSTATIPGGSVGRHARCRGTFRTPQTPPPA